MDVRRRIVCERARSYVSLGLDEELSELERAMLTAHLGRCDACAHYAEQVSALTVALRTAPLEQPDRTVVVGGRRRSLVPARAVQAFAAAAVVVVAVGVGRSVGTDLLEASAPRTTQPVTVFEADANRIMAQAEPRARTPVNGRAIPV
jgi:predicted anti-sigma-YlaC factor YlaD